MTLEAWRRKLWELGLRRCGLNADWSVEAWHVDRGIANDRGGDIYLIDLEDLDGQWALAQRWYACDGYAPLPEEEQAEMGLDGDNDAIEEILLFHPSEHALDVVARVRRVVDLPEQLRRAGFIRRDGER